MTTNFRVSHPDATREVSCSVFTAADFAELGQFSLETEGQGSCGEMSLADFAQALQNAQSDSRLGLTRIGERMWEFTALITEALKLGATKINWS